MGIYKCQEGLHLTTQRSTKPPLLILSDYIYTYVYTYIHIRDSKLQRVYNYQKGLISSKTSRHKKRETRHPMIALACHRLDGLLEC